MNFIERLNSVMKEQNIKQKDITEKLGITKGYVSRVCNGAKRPSTEFINAISELTGKSTHWLLFGKEEYDNLDSLNMYINTCIEKGLIDKDGNMTPKTRNAINALLDSEIDDKLQRKYNVTTSSQITSTTDKMIEFNTKDESIAIAAHANEGATEEQMKHDMDIMNDDSQW